MLIMDRLKQALAKAKRESSSLAVLFIDLDNFKRVNDTMGHQIGDDMLRVIAQRLGAELRYSDTLGRLGGDEFVVIMERLESHDAIATVSEKLLSSIATPLTIGNTEIIPSCSIGISLYPDNSADQDELVQMADTAMYAAKNKGRNNYTFYELGMTQSTAHYLTREMELRRALENHEFVLHFQPQCSLSKQRVTGVEALIRWQHPTNGLLPPIEIIPVAEASGLIVDIGNWVLDEACRQLCEWHKNGLPDMRMAVNVSIRQLADKRLPEFVEKLLQQYSLPPHLLELEVTESCLQNDTTNVICLQKLEKLGVSISIDDFGTGYSCMSSLKFLPIRRLKIDQAFVRDIPGDKNDCAIAAAIMALGRQLNMEVIAEGVETVEQVGFLGSIGCDELQGYYFSRPVEARSISELINSLPVQIQAAKDWPFPGSDS
jgi:diguanylate cyclase (GGDEF)-like protein